MKILFLVFHGFAAFNGISKKIGYQVEALRTLGHTGSLGSLIVDAEGAWKRMCDDRVIENFGTGVVGKLKKRWCYGSLTQDTIKEQFDAVYIRSNHNANPFTIKMVRQLRKAGIRTVMEIPTYPYDQEYLEADLKSKIELWIDQCFRRSLARQLDAIVTFTDYPEIFGQHTIQISNGISFSHTPLQQKKGEMPHLLRLIAVADISPWHGFDRVVQGLIRYYATQPSPATEVTLTIVGKGMPHVVEALHRLVEEAALESRVIFTGPLFGEALDDAFDHADLAIASLGRHRSGITQIKTLKNREYAARGIPFIYSEIDSDFENKPYILKVSADESPVDIAQLIAFYQQGQFVAAEIRASIDSLSWERQMAHVFAEQA